MKVEKLKIAVVFGHYNHPAQPYLKTWSHILQDIEGEIQVFSSNIDHKSSFSISRVLTNSGNSCDKLSRNFTYSSLWPRQTINWFSKRNGYSLIRKMGIWAEFGPLLAFSPKVVHIVNSYIYPKFSSILPEIKSKTIVSFRGFDTVVRPFSDSTWYAALSDLYKRIDKLHFVSNYLREQAISLGAPSEKCIVIYPGIDTDFFQPTQGKKHINKKEIEIVTTGRLTWQKGYIFAFQAIQKLIESGLNIKYRIIGNGDDYHQLSYWTRMLGIERHVQFLGQREPNDVKKYLNQSDIYLHPSITEAIPISVMEACAMKMPVVATSVGGLPELIEDGKNGCLISPADPQSMAQSLLELIDNRKKRYSLGEEGRKRIIEEFSVGNEIEKWTAVYNSLS